MQKGRIALCIFTCWDLRHFLFITVILAPMVVVAIVGGNGFLAWMHRLVHGPPTY